jgi:hypothetical protein
MDLIAAAVSKAGDDPNVLMGAYFLFVEQGLEEERPESHEWFQKALAGSGPDGPIQRFEIKELLTQQTEWDRHTRFVSEKVVSAEFPLAVAAPGLRTTIVDLVLRNVIRNSAISDGRRRTAIPLFAGRRLPIAVGTETLLRSTLPHFYSWAGLEYFRQSSAPLRRSFYHRECSLSSLKAAAGSVAASERGLRKLSKFATPSRKAN